MQDHSLKLGILSLILVIQIFTSSEVFGQVPDSAKIKQRSERLLRDKVGRDSLQKIFYSEPPFFEVSLMVNQQRKQLGTDSKFYATDGQKIFESKSIDSTRFGFDSLPDSVRFGLMLDSLSIETGNIRKYRYENGAYLTFGVYDNLMELRAKWKKGRRDEDFDEWNETGSEYLTAVKDKKVVRAARHGRIAPIEFVVFRPRVYGDGMIITFQNIKLK